MRHGKGFNHLSRKREHRAALLMNLACSLIEHKRINTTVAKAKELRRYVEPLITKSKSDDVHNRRLVFSYLKNKHAIKELFGEVAPKVATRPGGYTRIIRTGYRPGDNADMCLIELVDFNTIYGKGVAAPADAKKRTRRGVAKKKVTTDATTDVADAPEATDAAKDVKATAPKKRAPRAKKSDEKEETSQKKEVKRAKKKKE
ncbi:MAG: 50S ribosomal protein L17 [Flavobacteriales bacterium]|nr:50S ribosomal protein L17 [Flavobacteriales bacterium]